MATTPQTCPNCHHAETHSPMAGCLHATGREFCDCKEAWKPAPVTQRSPTMAQAMASLGEALTRVAASANPDWVAAAESAVSYLVGTGQPFTTDDVWDVLAERNTPAPNEPRALGPIMRAAVKSKVIRPQGTYWRSRRRHGAPLPVYLPWDAK